MVRKTVKISRAIRISKAVKTTKLCPVCMNKVIPGLFHLTISDVHKSEPINNLLGEKKPGYEYSSTSIRIHLHCFQSLSKQVKNGVRTMRKEIENNRLLIGAKEI